MNGEYLAMRRETTESVVASQFATVEELGIGLWVLQQLPASLPVRSASLASADSYSLMTVLKSNYCTA
jgi:hypothetical protein